MATEITFWGWGKYDYDAEREATNNGGKHDAQLRFCRENVPEDANSYDAENLIIDQIRKHHYWFSGDEHQRDAHGCPILLVGGKKIYYPCSWRYWGGIMADAHSTVKQQYDYMDFYMGGFPADDGKTHLPAVGVDIDEDGKNLE